MAKWEGDTIRVAFIERQTGISTAPRPNLASSTSLCTKFYHVLVVRACNLHCIRHVMFAGVQYSPPPSGKLRLQLSIILKESSTVTTGPH